MNINFKQIEHTADVGLEVEADSLSGLFAGAAQGMLEILFGEERHGVESKALKKIPIELNATIREGLLVKWLEEILFLIENKNELPVLFDIKELSATKLVGEVKTVSMRELLPRLEIKAVTYHNLEIKEKDGRYSVRIIFDV